MNVRKSTQSGRFDPMFLFVWQREHVRKRTSHTARYHSNTFDTVYLNRVRCRITRHVQKVTEANEFLMIINALLHLAESFLDGASFDIDLAFGKLKV